MTRYCGIYGYECTQVVNLGAAEIRPRYKVRSEAHKRARDKSVYSLTAVLVGDDIDDEMAFQLEAILSFIEHLDVIVSSPNRLKKYSPDSKPFSPHSSLQACFFHIPGLKGVYRALWRLI